MKVLQLVQKPQLRGAEIFTSQLSAHINRSGHKAALAFLFPGTGELPFADKTFHLNGQIKRRLSDIKAWRKLAQIIKEEQPDIIQANAGDTLKYAVFSKLLFRWKQPIVFRNASTISLYIKNSWAKKWNNFFFKHADKIVSVSEASAADFAALFPEFQHKIITIPIGIECEAVDAKEAVQVQSTTKPESPVLVHVGGFTHEKNHVGLISIFEQLLQRKSGAELHLVGDGPLRPKIEALVKEKNLVGKVHFHGFKCNAMEYMKNGDVLLLPSLIEGLPGVILEAFYCKTPVVAYNVGGIKEIVKNNETGYLVLKGDETAFVNALLSALEGNTYNQLVVKKAYQLVTQNYLNTKIAKEFLNVYASLIAA